MYTNKYIALLEEENASLKKRNAELEEKLKETKDDLYTAICKWNDTVDKLHSAYLELYHYGDNPIKNKDITIDNA